MNLTEQQHQDYQTQLAELRKAHAQNPRNSEITTQYQQKVLEITKYFTELGAQEWGQFEPYLADIFAVGSELEKSYSSKKTSAELLQRTLDFACHISHYLAVKREIIRPEWLQMGLEIAQRLADIKHQVHFLGELASFYSDKGNYKEAIHFYEAALVLDLASNNSAEQLTLLNGLAGVFGRVGENKKALALYSQILQAVDSQENNDLDMEAATLNNIAVLLNSIGKTEMAITYYEKALQIELVPEKVPGKATRLYNLGMAHKKLGQFEKATDYFEKSLALYRAIADKKGEAYVLSGIAGIDKAKGNLASAQLLYKQSLELQKLVKNPLGEAAVLNQIGQLYLGNKYANNALPYIEEAIKIAIKIGSKKTEAISYENLGVLYRKRNDVDSAIMYLTRAINLYHELNNQTAVGNLQKLLQEWQADKEAATVSFKKLFNRKKPPTV